jgi:hypothetical protein
MRGFTSLLITRPRPVALVPRLEGTGLWIVYPSQMRTRCAFLSQMLLSGNFCLGCVKTSGDTERRASWHLCTTHLCTTHLCTTHLCNTHLCPHSLPCHITCIDLSPRLRHLPHHSQVLSWPLQHRVLHLTDVWDTAAGTTHQPLCHHVTRAPCNSRFCT